MATTLPVRTTPYPNSGNLDASEFDDAMNRWFTESPAIEQAQSQLGQEMEDLAARAEAAAGELANTAWVSGTSYTAGQVRYSPITYFSYRRKTNGAGTTDPSLDTTNWALQTRTTAGGSDTTSSATDITLTASSGRLQVISMTAANKKVTLPSATTLEKGTPVFVIQNSGSFRFAVRKNGGVFLCYVNPGEVIAFGCSDISTAAGIWAISGSAVGNIYDGNTPETLNSVDSRYIAVAMLSATKAICAYRNNSSTFLECVILNFGSASGTPLQVSSEAATHISIAAQTGVQATVIYRPSANTNVKGCVLDISGNTITPGSVQTIHTGTTSTNNGTDLTVLSSTKLLCIYLSVSLSTKERVLDISGTTITASAEVTADVTSATAPHISIKAVSATKALLALINSSDNISLRLQSITGSTPAPTGSVLTISSPGTPPETTFGACVLDANR